MAKKKAKPRRKKPAAKIGRESLADARAVAEFDRLADQVRPADLAVFTAYCDAVGTWHEIREQIRGSGGSLVIYDGQAQANPLTKALENTEARILKLAGRLDFAAEDIPATSRSKATEEPETVHTAGWNPFA